jgi:hypothetical protein
MTVFLLHVVISMIEFIALFILLFIIYYNYYLDVHQLLMLFAGTLTYLGQGTFSSVGLYNIV